MNILWIHEIAGFLGGTENNVFFCSNALQLKGHKSFLIYGALNNNESEKFLKQFKETLCWNKKNFYQELPLFLKKNNIDIIYIHKNSNFLLTQTLLKYSIPILQFIHDHELYCSRGSRYFPWNRNVCNKKAGLHCYFKCCIVRNKNSIIPVKFKSPSKNLAHTKSSRSFNNFLVDSLYMKNELILHEFDSKKITVLPTAPPQIHSNKNNFDKKNTILFIGQIIRGKGVDFLIKSLKLIEKENWTCYIAGTGSHLSHCLKLSQKLQLNEKIKFTGHLNKEELQELLAEASVGVVSSVWPEPLGGVGYEFMAYQVPIVGFDVGGISHWLKNNINGFLVKSKDIKTMSQSIKLLLEDKSLNKKMGKSGQELFLEGNTFDTYINELELLMLKTQSSTR